MVSTIVVCSGGCSSVPKRCGLVLVYFECITSSVCDVLGSRSVIRERERWYFPFDSGSSRVLVAK